MDKRIGNASWSYKGGSQASSSWHIVNRSRFPRLPHVALDDLGRCSVTTLQGRARNPKFWTDAIWLLLLYTVPVFFFFLTSYARFWSFLYFSVVIILNNVFWCVWREKYRMRYSIFHKHKSIVKATSENGIPWSPRSLACMMDTPLYFTIFLPGFFFVYTLLCSLWIMLNQWRCVIGGELAKFTIIGYQWMCELRMGETTYIISMKVRAWVFQVSTFLSKRRHLDWILYLPLNCKRLKVTLPKYQLSTWTTWTLNPKRLVQNSQLLCPFVLS
jgi:hypothetical protein